MRAIQRPAGPKGHPIIGEVLAFRQSSPKYLLRIAQEYGDLVYFKLVNYHCYLVAHPDYVHEVLVGQRDNLSKSKLDRTILSKFLGNGILLSEGDFYKRQRKLAQPAFHTRRIAAYADIMVNYTRRMIAGWRDGETVNIDKAMMNLTMEIVSKTLFDTDIHGQAQDKVGHAIEELQMISNAEYQTAFPLPEWIPIPRNGRRKAARQTLDMVVKGFIQERRASGEQDRGDLLSMLMLSEDEDGSRMSDQQLRDEAVTLFAAGHETTSNALIWTWYLLSQHSRIEARLHEELDHVLGERAPTFEDLRALTYTTMVIKEAMRVYPPVWVLNGREVIEPIELGGYTLPKGSYIFVSPYVMHRHPKYWDHPEQFDPQRFSPENEPNIPKFAYFPFGGGPRVCIGNSFAMMEATLLLATIAQQFSASLIPGQQVDINPLITMSPKYGLEMQVRQREAIREMA